MQLGQKTGDGRILGGSDKQAIGWREREREREREKVERWVCVILLYGSHYPTRKTARHYEAENQCLQHYSMNALC